LCTLVTPLVTDLLFGAQEPCGASMSLGGIRVPPAPQIAATGHRCLKFQVFSS
jgi:hypothetical protein